jgi:hypothetical protein
LTDEQLHGLGAQACNMAKLDMEQGGFHFLLASYHECDERKLHRMSKIEALIVERVGEDWLNNSRTKDIGFKMLRTAVDLLPPDALVFATMTNRFISTAKFHQLTREQQSKLLAAGHDRYHQAVKEGLLDICYALVVIVQTPERVCIYQQNMDRGQPVGKPETHFVPQEEFDGRMKMFGRNYAVSE